MKLVFLQTTCGSTLYTTVFTEGSAAPQTALWRGPEPRFEPGTGESTVVARTQTSPPPHPKNVYFFSNSALCESSHDIMD